METILKNKLKIPYSNFERKLKLAYTAGIVDGEGCLSIRKRRLSSSKKRLYNHSLTLKVVNTDMRILIFLKNLFRMGTITPHMKKKGLKKSFRWILTGPGAESVLFEILPFLVGKKLRAKLCLKFRKTFGNRKYGRGRPLPKKIILNRESLRNFLMKMNQKGEKIWKSLE